MEKTMTIYAAVEAGEVLESSGFGVRVMRTIECRAEGRPVSWPYG